MPAFPELALSFGAGAAEYDRVRPDWPPAAIERAARLLGLGRDATVVDLAAGTGKLTRRLAERFEHVIAVEPDDRMRSLIGVEALAGSAERLPLAAGTVDCVFCGDAFHWFDAPAALREIARVLGPGGGLVLLWNVWWATEPPLSPEAEALLREPFERSGRAAAVGREPWLDAFPDSAFAPPRRERIAGEVTRSADDLVALQLTTSSIASLPGGERAALAAALRPLLADMYRLPVTTELHWTTRTG